MPAGGAPREDTGGFDWWAAPEERVVRQADPVRIEPAGSEPTAESQSGTEPGPGSGPELGSGTGTGLRTEPEPWPEAVTEPESGSESESESGPEPRQETAAAVYRQVQAGEEFQEVRREYRSFVFPACAAFLAWYLLYIVAAVTLPELMDHQVAGPFNVAWVLGLLQFASTFLITWLYARHARDRRDRTALGLRWETQDRLR